MTKELAWLLGYLLADGYISKYTSWEFICKYDDREILHKVKAVLKAPNMVRDYPHYKSPNSKLNIRKGYEDLILKYKSIKTTIPEQDIVGFERHFIRGLVDGDGTISIRHRNGNICRFAFIDEYPQITNWVMKTICSNLGIQEKPPRYVPQSHVWEIQWEGNIARLICWWLYHGDVEHCCLARKRQKYLDEIMDGKTFVSEDDEILYAAKARIEDSYVITNVQSSATLKWCHILQKCLSFNTVPVFHNPGKRKYYNLYIPKSKQIANTQDAQTMSA